MAFFDKIKNLFNKNDKLSSEESSLKQKKLEEGLEKTKTSLFNKITKTVVGKSKIDDSDLDDIEEILITSDIGVETSLKIIERLEKRVEMDKYINTDELTAILKKEIEELLVISKDITLEVDSLENVPYVIMVVGVNGVGKTTTIGKLAHKFKKAGL